MEFQIEPYLRYIDDKEVQVIGLNNRQFHLFYYSNSKGEPKDITIQKPRVSLQSQLYFFSDNCVIRKNGIIPNNKILFGGLISEKKTGAILPDDYQIVTK